MLKDRAPEFAEVQERVKALQQFDLGLMYTQDERFRKNIDRAAVKARRRLCKK